MSLRYVVGDTRDVTATIADNDIDLLFTSPPFLALRSYLPADYPDKHREIGSEANPAAFLDVLLALTAEWGRVLAPHGTLAVELGDTYSGSVGAGGDYTSPDGLGFHQGQPKFKQLRAPGWPLAKSLALIPQLYAIALAYGINPLTGQPSPAGRWRVRNVIMWHRPNPPVGALGDKWRPASSAITVACKGAKRWFDLDAVRTEPITGDRVMTQNPRLRDANDHRNTMFDSGIGITNPAGAPPLDWHTDGDLGTGHIVLSTQPYSGSHYATFPVALPRKIIDCMCPRQVCRVCGVARERVTQKSDAYEAFRSAATTAYTPAMAARKEVAGTGGGFSGGGRGLVTHAEHVTTGWSDCNCIDRACSRCNGTGEVGNPSDVSTEWLPCECPGKYRPGIVYDPFVGSGTTLAAAQDLGRDGIGADLDPRNADLARERVGMFLTVEEFAQRTPVAEPVL